MAQETVSISLEQEAPTVAVGLDAPDKIDSVRETEGIVSNMYIADKLSPGQNNSNATYQDLMNKGDVQGARNLWLEMTAQQRANHISGIVEKGQPDNAVQETADYVDNLNNDRLNRESVNTYSGIDEEEEIDRAENEMLSLYRERRAYYTRDKPWSDSLGDFLWSVVPGLDNYGLVRALEDAGYGPEDTMPYILDLADNMFNNTDELHQLRNFISDLPPRERVGWAKNFLNSVTRTEDNDDVALEIIDNVLGSGFGSGGFNSFFNYIDVAGTIPLTKVGTTLMRPLAKTSSAISTAKSMKNSEAVGEIIKDFISDPESMSKFGTTHAEVGDTLSPGYDGDTLKYITGRQEDESLEQLERTQLDEIQADIERQFQLADETIEGMSVPGLIEDLASREEIAANAVKDFNKTYDNVSDVQFGNMSEHGFEISYKIATKEGREQAPVEKIFFKPSDIAPIETPLEWYKNKFSVLTRQSLNARFSDKLRKLYVTDIERIINAQAFVTKGMKKVLQAAYPKGFKDADHAMLDVVLKEGARSKVFYTMDDLQAGVLVGGDNVRLTPKQIRAYFGVRNAIDIFGELEKRRIIKNMEARGVQWFTGETQQLGVQVYDDVDKAMDVFKDTPASGSPHISVEGDGLLNMRAGDGIIANGSYDEMTQFDWENIFDEGYVLVKSDSSNNLFQMEDGGGKTQWALVKTETIEPVEGKPVLDIIPGYLPQQRENAFFFIKQRVNVGLSGNSDFTRLDTKAWADNEKDAIKWMEENGGVDKYELLRDREMPEKDKMIETFNVQGGNFSGARSSSEIKYAGDNSTRGKMLNPLEGMQNYVNHIGRHIPISVHRMGLEKRTIDTAQRLMGIDGKPDMSIRTIDNVWEAANRPGIDSDVSGLLIDMFNQSRFVANIPTIQEAKFSQSVHKKALWLERQLGDKVPGAALLARGMYGMSARGVQIPDMVRAATFNMLLGLWNASQWFVQSSGFIVTASISPKSFLTAMPKVPGWTMMDQFRKGTKTQEEIFAWHKKVGLSNYVDAEEYKMWSRSGFLEGVESSSADYVSAMRKEMPYDAGVLKKIFNNPNYFYKAGELNNTRIAFATAMEDWRKAFPESILDSKSDEQLEWIRARAEIYRLNMGRGNQSEWNKGSLGVMLQFKQVMGKYYEKVMPRWATGTDELDYKEKMRLAAIPTVVTGLAGVPIVEDVVLGLANMLNINLNEAPPEVHTALRWGANQFFITHVLGIDSDVSSRAQLGTNFYEQSMRLIDEPQSIWKILMGPSGSVTRKIANEGVFIAKAFSNTVQADIPTGLKFQKAVSIILDSSSEFIKTASAFKEYKNFIFNGDQKLMRKSKYIRDLKDANAGTIASRMAGFNSLKEKETFDFQRNLKDIKDISTGGNSKFIDTTAEIMLRITNLHILGATSDEQREAGVAALHVMLNSEGGANFPELRQKMNELSFKKRSDPHNLYHQWHLLMLREQNEANGQIENFMNGTIRAIGASEEQ